MTEEVQFNNRFRVTFIQRRPQMEGYRIPSCHFGTEVLNGERWEDANIEGECNWQDCMTLIADGHLCGPEDLGLFAFVYERCGFHIGGYD